MERRTESGSALRGIMHWTTGFDLELLEALNRVAVESVAAGRLPAEAVLPGAQSA
jgi:hypothetical protein